MEHGPGVEAAVLVDLAGLLGEFARLNIKEVRRCIDQEGNVVDHGPRSSPKSGAACADSNKGCEIT